VSRPPWLARVGRSWPLALTILVSFVGLFALQSRLSALFDSDGYFHLAVAREYAERGLRIDLRWARMSAMADGFGDKEILFHVLLIPFAANTTSSAGGRLALALLGAAVLTIIGRQAAGAVGRWGYLLPFWLALSTLDFTGRLIRLRPELLSLLLFLIAIPLASRRRYRLLGLLALASVLTHTGFHALLVACVGWWVFLGVVRRRWEWPLVAYPALGTLLGLWLHPQFPANVRIWWLQNVTRWRVPLPDAGTEFDPTTLSEILLNDAGLWLGLIILAATFVRSDRADRTSEADTRSAALADHCWIAAAFFGLLFANLTRFGLYFAPLVALALLHEGRRRGLCPGAWVRLPGGRRIRLAVLGSALLLACAAHTVWLVHGDLTRGECLTPGREAGWRAFGDAVPRGAKVAAHWQTTDAYAFWAPQAEYLNVLDPIFMAAWKPSAYQAWRSVFTGEEPDVPLALVKRLDSSYLALPRAVLPLPVGERLSHDARMRPLYVGADVLYQVTPAPTAFILDWCLAPASVSPGSGVPPEVGACAPYVRLTDPTERALEGFVDATRLGAVHARSCVTVVRSEALAAAAALDLEFAPYGSATLWVDGDQILSVPTPQRAVLGRGIRTQLRLGRGVHVFEVQTCPHGGRNGFYLVEGSRTPLPR
jgi:hypothetical protein